MGSLKSVSPSEIEAVIDSLVSISSARIVTDRAGEIAEIHILADSSRMPKQVVRDIESALMAQFGIVVDHKKVSVAQTQNGRSFRFSEDRLKFADVSLSLNGVKSEASVRLKKGEEIFTGSEVGHSSQNNQLRLIAGATIKAIEKSQGWDGKIVLEDIDASLNLCGKNAVVVCVNVISPRGEDLLTGSALVKQDLSKAVVNATLDAINRRLGSIGEQ